MNLVERYIRDYHPFELLQENDFFCRVKEGLPHYATNGTQAYHYPWQGKILACTHDRYGGMCFDSEDGIRTMMHINHIIILPDRWLQFKPANWDSYVANSAIWENGN